MRFFKENPHQTYFFQYSENSLTRFSHLKYVKPIPKPNKCNMEFLTENQ